MVYMMKVRLLLSVEVLPRIVNHHQDFLQLLKVAFLQHFACIVNSYVTDLAEPHQVGVALLRQVPQPARGGPHHSFPLLRSLTCF
jgi:hypothetical protein